jgi:hypothetical protein
MSMLEVEVWQNDSMTPQRLARRGRQFALAYLVGSEPALVRLPFHPLGAGKAVIVKLDRV